MEKIYTGKITHASNGEEDNLLGLDNERLAEIIQNDLEQYGRSISVQYYVSDEPKTFEELEENEIKKAVGYLEADYGIHFSDYTGYLWTDEMLEIGGHDLLEELKESIGKYLCLKIIFS